MKCLLCKADAMEKGTNTYFARLDSGYVIIENVPCLKCAQCGEVVYSASVIEKIEEIIEKTKTVASRLFVLDYATAV